MEISSPSHAKSKKRYTSRTSNHMHMEMSSMMTPKHHRDRSNSGDNHSTSTSTSSSSSSSGSSGKSKYFKLNSSPSSSGAGTVAAATKLLSQTGSTIFKSYAPPTSAIHHAYERSGVPYLVNTVMELLSPTPPEDDAASASASSQKKTHRSNRNSGVSGDYSAVGQRMEGGDDDEKEHSKDDNTLGQFEFDDPYISDHLLFNKAGTTSSKGRRVSSSSSIDEKDLNSGSGSASKSSFL